MGLGRGKQQEVEWFPCRVELKLTFSFFKILLSFFITNVDYMPRRGRNLAASDVFCFMVSVRPIWLDTSG